MILIFRLCWSLTSACRCDDQQKTHPQIYKLITKTIANSNQKNNSFALVLSVMSVVGHRNGKPKLKTNNGFEKFCEKLNYGFFLAIFKIFCQRTEIPFTKLKNKDKNA